MRLDWPLKGYRIGDPAGAHPIFDATGSTLFPGRWNTANHPVLYAAAHYSTAMLEKLVHGSGALPPNQHWIEITVPTGVTYEMFSVDHLPTWADPSGTDAKAYGATWQASRRTLLLIVPSVVARVDENYLLNPEHPDFHKVTYSLSKPCWWDSRLFPSSAVIEPAIRIKRAAKRIIRRLQPRPETT